MDRTWWLQSGDLDDDQRLVISLPIENDCLVIGPPGSGKTNLLLLRASFLGKSGHNNFSIVTFTRVLKEFLSSGASNYQVSADNAVTYFSWARQVLSENGIEVEDGKNFKETRENIHNALEGLSEAVEKSSIFDYILIDEVQDYTHQEIETIRKFAKYIYAVGDSKQRIHVSDDTIRNIQGSFSKVRELKFHYRNGIKICRLADGILNQVDQEGCMESTSQYNEEEAPSVVRRNQCATLELQVEQMIPIIETQLVAYPEEQIGVLVPKTEDLETVVAVLKGSSLADSCMYQMKDNYLAFDNNSRVVVGTVHSTKGMEFRACHFLAADTVKRFRSSQKKMAFTACTRAKTSLTVYHTGNLPPYFLQAFSCLEPKPGSPSLDSLFPSGQE